ncbi:ribonuclease E/G [Kordiimonas marina]|uniref:ribonuclease E/G n=1 Tax=Kordiimonas marina TaxID=2872312 RepID=UPI001FF33C1F|nr:ribonuclease E/G [Kordiimonas marina]MCJ9430519.1 ribonuclease E/G [Kordiimonas marina]
MTGTMLIEPGIGQWRSAVLGDDELPVTLTFHEDIALSAAGALFDARVTRVDAHLDIAFLDLGDDRDGMLSLRRAKLIAGGRAETISDCVTEGQMLRVQVVAEPSALDDKALPVTPRPRLTGRYVVAEAGGARLSFSKDLGPKTVKTLTPMLTGAASRAALIVRSRAGEVPAEAVAVEADWLTGILGAKCADKPGLVHAFSPLEQALLAVGQGTESLLIEGADALAQTKAMAETRWPDLSGLAELYKDTTPMFEAFGVEEAIEEALGDRIELPSGGWLSVHETPAVTAIDVNMGGALKGRSAGEAKLVVNLEAALAIAYHLRFQDIGGLVVVDFIDMAAKGAAKDLMDVLSGALKEDHVPVQHTGLSMFGLMELNRKRSGLSLRQRMLRQHKATDRPAAVALKLIRDGVRLGRTASPGNLTVTAPKPVLTWLERHTDLLDALKAQTSRAVTLAEGTPADIHLG